MKRQAEAGVHEGWPYSAVGMHRTLDSSIGFPSRSTRASRMLVFVTPPDVRRSFKLPPEGVDVGENVLGAYRSVRGRDWQAGENSSGPARSSVLSSRDISERSRSPEATSRFRSRSAPGSGLAPAVGLIRSLS